MALAQPLQAEQFSTSGTSASVAQQIRAHFMSATAIGLLAGLLDGLQEFGFTADPVRFAARKLGAEVLWAAPLTTALLFLAVAVITLPFVLLARLGPPWTRRVGHVIHIALAAWLVLGSSALLVRYAVYILTAAITLRALFASQRTFARLERLAPRGALLLAATAVTCYATAITWKRIQDWRAEAALVDASPASPNVLLIVLDTFRRDLLFGPGSDSLLPNLTALRSRGVSFVDAWATSAWSLPSQASILTGMFPHEHSADWPGLRFGDFVHSLPERLRDKGYATGAFSGNFAWVTPEYLGRGFLRFVSYNHVQALAQTTASRFARRRGLLGSRMAEAQHRSAAEIQSDFLRFVDARSTRPFFAYICFMDANRAIYNALRTARSQSVPETPGLQGARMKAVVDSYRRAASELDRAVASLLDSLQRRDRLDNTLVIVTSDHGQSFGPTYNADRAPAGHATTLYTEQTSVPLIIAGAGVLNRGVQVNQSVSLRDIAATIGDIAGIAMPGHSLLTLASDSTANVSPVLLSLFYLNRHVRGIVSDAYWYAEKGRPPRSTRELIVRQEGLSLGEPIRQRVIDSLSRVLHDKWDDEAKPSDTQPHAAAPPRSGKAT